jgi:ABC-2 type transport system ATP-binding protein
VDAVCTRAIIITSGKIVADETPDELRQRSEYAGAVDLTVLTDSPERALAVLKEFQGVKRVDMLSHQNGEARFLVVPQKGKKIAPEIARLVHTKNWTVETFTVERGRLDEVFRTITTTQEGGRT